MPRARVTVRRRADAVFVTSPTFSLRVWEPCAGVVLQAMDGRTPLEAVREILAVRDTALVRAGKLVIGIDALRVTGYEPGVRDLFDEWTYAHRDDIIGQHILLQSGVLKMAMELTNLAATRNVITSHGERAAFERALLDLAPQLDLAALRVGTAETA
jgi:hypothetical protein